MLDVLAAVLLFKILRQDALFTSTLPQDGRFSAINTRNQSR